jgi:hypothetical protein
LRNRGTGAGGANTNATGLSYEQKTDLSSLCTTVMINNNYCSIKFNGHRRIFIQLHKSKLHKYMKTHKMMPTIPISAGCKSPDEAYLDNVRKVLYIIEKKFQQTSGSVDEKIQTGAFKLYHYSELFPTYKIYYIYCLSDWFKKDEYKSVLTYLEKQGIYIFWGSDPDYKTKIIRFMNDNE